MGSEQQVIEQHGVFSLYFLSIGVILLMLDFSVFLIKQCLHCDLNHSSFMVCEILW